MQNTKGEQSGAGGGCSLAPLEVPLYSVEAGSFRKTESQLNIDQQDMPVFE